MQLDRINYNLHPNNANIQCTGYGTVNTISFLVSVTRLVLTPTLTLNDPLSQNFTTKWHRHFKVPIAETEMCKQITINT